MNGNSAKGEKQPLPLLIPFTAGEFTELVRAVVRDEMLQVLRSFERNASSNDEPLLTRKEIASYLRISLVTLTDWVKRGLPSHPKRGRVLFLKSEVLEWLKANHPRYSE